MKKFNKQPKVLILWNAGKLSFGGTTILTKTLLSGIKSNKIEVVGITNKQTNKAFTVEFIKNGINILDLRKDIFKFIGVLIKAISERKKIVLYSYGAGRLPIYIKNILPFSIYVYHECVNVPEGECLAKKCLLKSDYTILNSIYVKDDILSRIEFKGKVALLPTLVSPHKRVKKGVEYRGKRIIKFGYIGRFSEHKRVNDLIREWPLISKNQNRTPPELHVFSDIPDQTKNNLLITAQEKSVYLHPPFTNIELADKISEIDCLLLPSLWEGQPISLVEAALIGVPFVVCEGNGCNDFALENPDVIVCSKQWDHFKKSVEQMHENLLQNRISSERLAQWAEKRFCPQKTLQKYISFFENISL